jgi:hypothetical protein
LSKRYLVSASDSEISPSSLASASTTLRFLMSSLIDLISSFGFASFCRPLDDRAPPLLSLLTGWLEPPLAFELFPLRLANSYKDRISCQWIKLSKMRWREYIQTDTGFNWSIKLYFTGKLNCQSEILPPLKIKSRVNAFQVWSSIYKKYEDLKYKININRSTY